MLINANQKLLGLRDNIFFYIMTNSIYIFINITLYKPYIKESRVMDAKKPTPDINSILECFRIIHAPQSDNSQRKKVNEYLIEIEKEPTHLLSVLLDIIDNQQNEQLRFQALLFFGNVVKRNWALRRYKEAHSQFQALKKKIRTKMLLDLYQAPKQLIFSYFEVVRHICKVDFPHNYPEFSQLALKLTEELNVDQQSVVRFKELSEIFGQLAQRKGSVSKKMFQQSLESLLDKLCQASLYFKVQIEKAVGGNTLQEEMVKLSKYCDKIILCILRMGSGELLQYQKYLIVVKGENEKLVCLLNLHQRTNASHTRLLLEKNIKSLLYDMSALMQSQPFLLTMVLGDYFDLLSRVIAEPKTFGKNTTLKYALLAMRKFIREFAFYAEDQLFLSSIGSKPKSSNYIDLRNICHKIYCQCMTPVTVQGLLNHLVVSVMGSFSRSQSALIGVEDSILVDRAQEKQLSVQASTLLLVEALLERFAGQTHQLVRDMVISAHQNQFKNLDPLILGNVISVLSLLPKTCKGSSLQSLNDVPIVDVLSYLYKQPGLQKKVPALVGGWLDYFNGQQLGSLVELLLGFIEKEPESSLVLDCCQCLNRIILGKKFSLGVGTAQKVFPVAVTTFQKSQNPQLLWPMVQLLSNIISQGEVDSELILQSLENSQLVALISHRSSVLVDALSQMFRNFLCAIPRNRPASSLFRLACHFLNQQLKGLPAINAEKVLDLWYIVVREYSPPQKCEEELIELYQSHYRNCLFFRSPTLVYVLEEYMLLGFVEPDLNQFSLLIYEFYQQAEQLERQERDQLKIAALSFMITLITKYTLTQLNSQYMLQAMLKDFYCPDPQVVSPTVHNSLLSIFNRYLILHREDFLAFLTGSGIDLSQFYRVYLDNMQFLTSQSAKKLNAIGVLSVLPSLPQSLLIQKLHYVLMTVIPSVENYISTRQVNPLTNSPFSGKITNSPTLRFASNFLSERKEEIRKQGMFQEVNLHKHFCKQVQATMQTLGIDLNTVGSNFSEQKWAERFYRLLGN